MPESFSRSPYHCPRCTTPMLLGNAGGMSLHGCPSCGGVWLGTECAVRFSIELPPAALEVAAKHAAMGNEAVDKLASVACPVCGAQMQRTIVMSAGLDLDSCVKHGTWYDRHELERIARVIASTRRKPQPELPLDLPSAPFNSNEQRLTQGKTSGNTGFVIPLFGGAADMLDAADDALDTAGVRLDVVGAIFDFFSKLFD